MESKSISFDQEMVLVMEFPANWTGHGKAAVPIRNKEMLEIGEPELVVGFSGGPGTMNMLDTARKAGYIDHDVENYSDVTLLSYFDYVPDPRDF